ncbi:serine/threonine protein kinase, partial [Streptomyces sp. NPDC002690]
GGRCPGGEHMVEGAFEVLDTLEHDLSEGAPEPVGAGTPGSPVTPVGKGAATASASGGLPPRGPGASTRASLTDVVPRRTLAIIAGVVVLAIVGTVLALSLGGDDTGDKDTGGQSSAAGSTGGPDGSGKGKDTGKDGTEGQGKSDGSASPSTAGTPSGSAASPGGTGSGEDGDGKDDKGGEDDKGGDALPQGYKTFTDSRFHFTMAMPGSYGRTAIAGSNSGGIYNASKGAFPRVQIDYNSSPGKDAAAAWTAAVAGVSAASNNYKHIGIKKVDYNGYPTVADWEFERTQNGERVHVLNRGFRADSTHGYSIMVSCPAAEWNEDECRTLRETAFATFAPKD